MKLTYTQLQALKCYADGTPRWTRYNTLDALIRRGLVRCVGRGVQVTLSGRSVLAAHKPRPS